MPQLPSQNARSSPTDSWNGAGGGGPPELTRERVAAEPSRAQVPKVQT